ncbi:hypothetical protein IWZ03DRAFT_26973 [Phyllosticta citriasiana]|uniref:Uncharacterized protein n=1 Tax=Phyllosticta citriasiana TaxID=595635 RepID=A0ABR1L0R2_9PEZI
MDISPKAHEDRPGKSHISGNLEGLQYEEEFSLESLLRKKAKEFMLSQRRLAGGGVQGGGETTQQCVICSSMHVKLQRGKPTACAILMDMGRSDTTAQSHGYTSCRQVGRGKIGADAQTVKCQEVSFQSRGETVSSIARSRADQSRGAADAWQHGDGHRLRRGAYRSPVFVRRGADTGEGLLEGHYQIRMVVQWPVASGQQGLSSASCGRSLAKRSRWRGARTEETRKSDSCDLAKWGEGKETDRRMWGAKVLKAPTTCSSDLGGGDVALPCPVAWRPDSRRG